MASTGVTTYALSRKSDKKNFRYVGQARNKNTRLGQHIRAARLCKGINLKFEKWIREAIAEGDEIITTTMRVTPNNTWSDDENEVMEELRAAGHDLFNQIGGSIVGFFEDDWEHEADPLPTIEEFMELEWIQTYAMKKKREWKATFHDTQLTRTNWRVCVIKADQYDRVAGVNGHGVEGDEQLLAEAVVEKICIEAENINDQLAQAIRLRPKFYE